MGIPIADAREVGLFFGQKSNSILNHSILKEDFMSDLCQGCDKREFCSCLCPEAELYVNEEYVPQREGNYGLKPPEDLRSKKRFELLGKDINKEPKKTIKFSPTEKKVVSLLAEGKKYKEISEELNITYHSVETFVYKIRKKTADATQKQ
jgi:DNA-binding CsgD family transcriptional regulator